MSYCVGEESESSSRAAIEGCPSSTKSSGPPYDADGTAIDVSASGDEA